MTRFLFSEKRSSFCAINAAGAKVALDGAAAVGRNVSFEIVVNESLDGKTVNTNTVKVFKGTEAVAIDTPQADNKTIKFSTLSVLDASADYTVVVNGVKSQAGSEIVNKTVASFKTAATVVAKKVQVTGLTPLVGAATTATLYNTSTTDANPYIPTTQEWDYATSTITTEFDEAIDKASLSSSTLKLVEVETGKTFSVSYGDSATNRTVSLSIVDVKNFLTPKKQYKVVYDGLKTLSGKTVDPFELAFVYQADKPVAISAAGVLTKAEGTAVTPALVNPKVEALMLDSGLTADYHLGVKFKADFGAGNAKLDASTVTSDYFFIREVDTQEKVAVNVSYNEGANYVEIVPTKDLKDDTDYEVVQSPFVKNIYGVTVGTRNSDEKTVKFHTLDATAPTVTEVISSTGSLTNLPLDKVVKVTVKFSEEISNAVLADLAAGNTAVNFAAGTATSNVLVTRSDDDTIGLNSILAGAPAVTSVTRGTDNKSIVITIDGSKAGNDASGKNALTGKSFRTTLAGHTPVRKNTSGKVISDVAAVPNSLDQDYVFSFSFEGEDTTAPTIEKTEATQDGTKLVSATGLTNVDPSKIRVYFDSKDVKNASVTGGAGGTVSATLNGSTTGVSVAKTGSVVQTANGSYVDFNVTVPGGAEGNLELKLVDIEDAAGNKMSTKKVNFLIGDGPTVSDVKFVDATSVDYAGTSYAKIGDAAIKVTFGQDNVDRSTLSNIKVYDGTTEVAYDVVDSYLNNTADKFVVLLPKESLKENTAYKVVVGSDVKNNVGNKLQQNPAKAPADYSVLKTTDITTGPQLVSSALDATARTLTLTFNQDIDSVNVPANVVLDDITNSAIADATLLFDNVNNDTKAPGADGKADNVKITDNKVVITLFNDTTDATNDAVIKKDHSYAGTITVASKALPLTNKAVAFNLDSTVKVASDIDQTRPTFANVTNIVDGKFTVTFNGYVNIDSVKAALKLTNVSTAKAVTILGSSVVATDNNADIDGLFGADYVGVDDKYAKTFEVTIPGFGGSEHTASHQYALQVAVDSIKDFVGFTNEKAYDKVLTATTQAALDTAAAQAAADAAVPTYNGTDASVSLPANQNGQTVTWTSGTPGTITDAGVVTRPIFSAGDASVNMTASVTVNGQTATKVHVVTVNKKDFAAASQAVADNTFTITPDGYALTDFSAATGSIEFATGNTDTVTVNGITYTITYVSGTGIATVAATAGAATATAGIATETINIIKDGKTATLTLNIPAVTASDAFGTVTVTVTP